MRAVFLSFFVLLAAIFAMAPAAMAVQCGPTEQVLIGLSERYQETVAARAVLADGNLLMITARPDGASWTLLQVSPAGTTCLLAAGTGWEAMPPAPAGTEG